MIKYSVPFLITELSQIPEDLVEKYNLHLEGIIFDYKRLSDNDCWRTMLKNIKTVNEKYNRKLIALHFPIENANYLESKEIQKKLKDFIKISSDNGINKVILHSNYIQGIEEYSKSDLESIRSRFYKFFKNLDIFLEGKNTTVCVENMPIIGNDGSDYDSVFVLPDNFSEFNYKNIKITWDLGHWAYTFYLIKKINNISKTIKDKKINFEDFYLLKDQIAHFHFSSFRATTTPAMKNICHEGICPQNGSFKESILKSIIKKIASDWNDIDMTLEINEKDYTKRVNLEKTLNWLESI